MKNYVGIDVAKTSLAVAFPSPTAGWTNTTFANTPDGIRSLMKQLPPQAHCILEATGSYSVLVTYMLCQAEINVSVINPKQSHNFAKMQMSVTKTDPRDAVLLAEYGRLIQPPLYQMATDSLLRLRQKRALLRQYHKQRRTLLNLQHSFAVLPVKDSSTEQSLQTIIATFEQAIIDLQQEVCQLCEAEYYQQYQRLLSIKGISHKVATALIETTNGFRDFQSAKAVAKFIGLAPTTFQSGKMSTHRGICRTGDSHLRSMLYVASWSAIRCNKACREFYQRLKAAGKPSKLALIAVANKLLRQAFALVRFGEDFDDNYQPKFRSVPCI